MEARRSLNVLVTGGSGFVGMAVIEELIRRGHRVIATTRTLSETLPADQNLSWISWDAMHEALPQVDWKDVHTILHLAAPTTRFTFPEEAPCMYEVAIAATFRFLEAARKNGVQRVLVASTGDVLGSNERPACEDDLLYMPSSFYGTAKACAELLLRSYQSILSTAILRFYHPYGPRGDRFLINRLVKSVRESRQISIQGKDGIILNPVWIDDLAVGVCLAVESYEMGIFHFAGPQTLTLRELVNMIGMIVKREPIIHSEPGPCIQRHAGAFELTHRVLGYTAKVSPWEGLQRLVASPA